MTIETRLNKNIFVGNGTTYKFDYTFRAWEADQIQVLASTDGGVTEQDVTDTVSVSVSDDVGGSVIFPTAPASGTRIAVVRRMPFIQEDEYVSGTRIDPHEFEDRFDQDCAERQELLDGVDRAIKAPVTSTKTPEEAWEALWIAYYAAVDVGTSTPVLAAGSTTPRTLGERFADIINVKDFGAKGDGVTDDSAALNAAILAAAQAGKRLYIDGQFLCVDSCVEITSLTRLVGAPGARIIRGFNQNSTGYKLAAVVPLPNESTVYDVTIDGVIWDGNGDEFGLHGFDIIVCSESPARNISIQNCVFRDVVNFHAIDLLRCDGVRIEGCRFEGWKFVDFNGDDVANEWAADKREAIQLDGGGLTESDIANLDKNIVIRNNYFGPSTTTGFGPWPAAVGNHGWMDTPETCRNITIIGNVFDRLSYYAVTCLAWKNVIVSGNTFIDCNGVSVIARNKNRYVVGEAPGYELINANAVPDGVVITGNTFSDNREAEEKTASPKRALYAWWSSGRTPEKPGPTFPSNLDDWIDAPERVMEGLVRNVTFSGNTLRGLSQICDCIGCSGLVISGNIVEDAADNVCKVGMSTNVSIVGNSFSDFTALNVYGKSSAYTYYAEAARGHIVSGNVFRNPANKAISIGGNAPENIITNNLIYAATDTGTDEFIAIASTSTPSRTLNNTVCVNSTTRTGAIFTNSRNAFNNSFFVNGDLTYPYSTNNSSLLPDSRIRLFVRQDADNYFRAAYCAYAQGDNYELAGITKSPGGTNIIGYLGRGTSGSNDFDEVRLCLTSAQYLKLTTSALRPYATSTIALGSADQKYTALYADTGTIQTSDSREKSGIAEVDDKALDAWGAVGIKAFQYTGSVGKKGADGARVHAGIVAQDVAQAFEKAGLDASRFGVFCHDEWDDEYETVLVIDKEAELDENGEEISPAVAHTEQRLMRPAGDAYSIRYAEALCLEAAYQRRRADRLEARLEAIETQITAIENA